MFILQPFYAVRSKHNHNSVYARVKFMLWDWMGIMLLRGYKFTFANGAGFDDYYSGHIISVLSKAGYRYDTCRAKHQRKYLNICTWNVSSNAANILLNNYLKNVQVTCTQYQSFQQ